MMKYFLSANEIKNSPFPDFVKYIYKKYWYFKNSLYRKEPDTLQTLKNVDI